MSDNPKLLVVDDEEVICQACRRIFSRQGFQVEVNTDACNGLNCALHGDYAAILLDIKMPKIDGIQFLERLRETKPDQPVLIMTGYPSIPNATAAMRLGASDYITKPFRPDEITRAVQRIVGRQTTKEAEATKPAAGPDPQTPQSRRNPLRRRIVVPVGARRIGVRRRGAAGSAGRDGQERASAADRRSGLPAAAAGRRRGGRQAGDRRPLARLRRGRRRQRRAGRGALRWWPAIRAGGAGSPAFARRSTWKR